jgi:XTP/dITP diphosphohydrolase
LLTVLVTSPRVAPGLLSWEAWSVLREAPVVTAPAGHPQLPALAAAGVAVTISAEAPSDGVWLAPPTADFPADFPAQDQAEVPAGARVIEASADLPGAHLLDLVATMDRLRTGCPWDAEQTHMSLAPYLLEEPYEALDALEAGNLAAFREELGDVLFQVVFHARIAENFDIDDVADGLVQKLMRRHPHVFGSVTVADAEEVMRNWDAIKKREREERAVVHGTGSAAPSATDGVPFGQPALTLTAQLQRRAARAGAPGSLISADEGIGGELFMLVAKAQAAGLDPELELRAAARQYRDRVRAWEREQPT